MTDLRKAAEMALEALERLDRWLGLRYGQELTPPEKDVVEALRQALDDKPPVKSYCGGVPNYCTPEVTHEVPCKTHPDAPHGFDRNASHSADRYVCECEGWEPVDNAYTKNDTKAGVLHKEWVGLTDEEIYDYADKFLYQHGSNYGIKSFGKALEAKLKEKNGG